MEYGQIPGINKPISRLVQGTVMISMKKLEESMALLDGVYALGCTTFDTAHGYGNGDCERTLGHWYNERGLRDKVVVLGKGSHHNQDRQRVTPYDISADLMDSLARQQTDFIDLYVLHRDDTSQPVGPIIETLNEHQAAGRIHVFGASNWMSARIEEAHDYAAKHGLNSFTVSSPNFTLAVQQKEPWIRCVSIAGPAGEGERAYYAKTNMPLFTWSSLAGGFFTGRFDRDNLDSFDSYGDKLCVECYCTEENFQRLDRVKELGAEKGLSLPQIATAYVMNYPLNIFALVGCATPDEYKANMEAMTLKLSPEELAWLNLERDSR